MKGAAVFGESNDPVRSRAVRCGGGGRGRRSRDYPPVEFCARRGQVHDWWADDVIRLPHDKPQKDNIGLSWIDSHQQGSRRKANSPPFHDKTSTVGKFHRPYEQNDGILGEERCAPHKQHLQGNRKNGRLDVWQPTKIHKPAGRTCLPTSWCGRSLPWTESRETPAQTYPGRICLCFFYKHLRETKKTKKQGQRATFGKNDAALFQNSAPSTPIRTTSRDHRAFSKVPSAWRVRLPTLFGVFKELTSSTTIPPKATRKA